MEFLAISVVVLFLVFLLAGLRHVAGQRVLTVRRLGRYRRTLGPGWHWIVPGLERAGLEVALTGHHLQVSGAGGQAGAELYYQIVEPQKAGETLDRVDAWVTTQVQEALRETAGTPEQLQQVLNQRVGRLGLRVIRCSMHVA